MADNFKNKIFPFCSLPLVDDNVCRETNSVVSFSLIAIVKNRHCKSKRRKIRLQDNYCKKFFSIIFMADIGERKKDSATRDGKFLLMFKNIGNATKFSKELWLCVKGKILS